MTGRKKPRPVYRKAIIAAVVLLLTFSLAPAELLADQQRADMSKSVGDRAPIFSLATSQGTLVDYDRDYYGKHHLVMTFVPAAFTPV
ncbi:hypothetical protein [Geoalkalibacter subterraneus]|uniref:hypothetical protein n=1 Tax=Geoalkalibacter subterraneus TaxID=483547 RepID=UPI001185532F|nr:hypothetical protein [Geoalkalibacter subterraneus]